MSKKPIILKNVRTHTLKGVDLRLESGQLVVFSGVSGSGKSSMAFDTLFVEGQRRYVESLSTFARRHLGELAQPDADSFEGLSPTIAIEQKTAGRNPRSTVGTMTEIYDYLRVLFARVATPHCPESGTPLTPQSRDAIIKTVQEKHRDTRLMIAAPVARGQKGEFKDEIELWQRRGFVRVRIDGTIYALDDEIHLDGSVAHDVDVVIDRVRATSDNASRLGDALITALDIGEGLCVVVADEEDFLYSMHAYSPESGKSYPALTPQDFSFNSPSGMCPDCQGLGVVEEFDLDKVIDPKKSIAEDCCLLGSSYQTVKFGNIADNLARLFGFRIDTPWQKLSGKAQKIFLYGTDKKWTKMQFVHPTRGTSWSDYVQWRGVLHEAHQRLAQAQSDSYRAKYRALMRSQTCPQCLGSRLAPYPNAARLDGVGIATLTAMSIGEVAAFFEHLALSGTQLTIAEELLKEIRTRLGFLIDVGLHYLALSRTAPTLSGGEAQRVRLAAQVGCGLVGVTYVLDEPSIGLHPRDNKRLLKTLEHLRDAGNTVVVVEHDEETIRRADRIVDFGPKAGSQGGDIVVDGTVDDLLASDRSLTGAYLSGRRTVPVPNVRRAPSGSLTVQGAHHHNLKQVDVPIPLGLLVAVTGVSGSGKSSLVADTLYPALANTLHNATLDVGAHTAIEGLDQIDKVIAIDQSPIGRNPRSNPCTYVKVFDRIRDLFCQLPESAARGYAPGRFSFNVKEGSCSHCSGMGATRIDMDFMADTWVTCPECQGKRFDPDTLAIHYREKSIADVLDMTIEEACTFFEKIPPIARLLRTLLEVGLGYLKLGQPSPTLSGGEAQRIKLAKELSRPSTGQTLYILDEPTTGLHFYDIEHLLTVLQALVEKGNTVLVIEHNLEVMRAADWIVELGPEGGAGGGQLIASGTPEEMVTLDTPTAIALRPLNTDTLENQAIADPQQTIRVEGATQNNLKSLDVMIPRGKVTVCTGPSGSGKSSLAFETIYAEGQRRYTESLSPYARQFVQQMPKPKVENVSGLSPAVAIEQKAHAGNPRSTVGTLTEVYDYLRLLWARLGTPHCPETGEVIQAISKEHVIDRLLAEPPNNRFWVLAPVSIPKGMPFAAYVQKLQRQGFLRIRLNGELYTLDGEIPFNRRRKNQIEIVVDRMKTGPNIRPRLAEALERAASLGNDRITIALAERDLPFNLAFAVESTGKSYPPITPHAFSFNRADGMCPDCHGLGVDYGANLLMHEGIMTKTVRHVLELLWGETYSLDEVLGLDPDTKLCDLEPEALKMLLNGSQEEVELTDGSRLTWRGIHPTLSLLGRAARPKVRDRIHRYLSESPCASCSGTRLHALARHVTIKDHSLGQVCQMPIGAALGFLKQIKLAGPDAIILGEVHRQLVARLAFLCEVGLDYLSLHRSAPSLSNGEAQRIRLARQLGSSLSGVLYVLDEPTVGLHPQDSEKLNAAISKLTSLGNTILMVEHDPLTIQAADHIIDFGPGAGKAGGHIVAQGSYKEITANPKSITGPYLAGTATVPLPEARRKGRGQLTLKGARRHNLQNVSASFPIGAFTCVTGPSGAGKSSLVSHLLAQGVAAGLRRHDSLTLDGATITGIDAFDRLLVLDQNPIGHTSRADVGTYADILPPLRRFYASLPQAKIHGLAPACFSTNHRKGMCTHCRGLGYRNVELQFLPSVRVPCDECRGLRLNGRSLELEYGGFNFGQLLKLTVQEARDLFAHDAKVTKKLDTLISVGLGYLTLGQEIASLSGGEAQRMKISRELSKRGTKKTLYLLDEPTTGLHFTDITLLVGVLQRLVDKGATIIAIEHNLDFIKQADLVIDMGPGAGQHGGHILATGTPEELTSATSSITGQYLASLIGQGSVNDQ